MPVGVNNPEVQRFFARPKHVTVLNEVLDAITAAPLLDTMDIKGTITYASNVLRVNTLTFFDGGILVLSNVEAPFIAIAAQNLVIDLNSASSISVITRPVGQTAENAFKQMLSGATGANGNVGANGSGTVGGIGRPGGNGSDGEPGGNGQTLTLPDLFLFTQAVTLGANTPANAEVLTFYYNGVAGGNGGRGGNGGTGGNGARGQDAQQGNYGDCKSTGGDGGHGGNGGRGGRGGDTGNGGDGGWVSFYSPVQDVLQFFSVQQQGAAPGNPGNAGTSGRGGIGGQGGSGSLSCDGGHGGYNGSTPGTLGPGTNGTAGQMGQTDNEYRDNQDLWGDAASGAGRISVENAGISRTRKRPRRASPRS